MENHSPFRFRVSIFQFLFSSFRFSFRPPSNLFPETDMWPDPAAACQRLQHRPTNIGYHGASRTSSKRIKDPGLRIRRASLGDHASLKVFLVDGIPAQGQFVSSAHRQLIGLSRITLRIATVDKDIGGMYKGHQGVKVFSYNWLKKLTERPSFHPANARLRITWGPAGVWARQFDDENDEPG